MSNITRWRTFKLLMRVIGKRMVTREKEQLYKGKMLLLPILVRRHKKQRAKFLRRIRGRNLDK